jgi:hypothetical protein
MAGPYYVRSTDGSDASDGLSWANAKATVQGALAVAAPGERVWVSQVHAESVAGALVVESQGTFALPVEVFCGNDAAEPPTARATGASLTSTGVNNVSIGNGNGVTVWDGLTFSCGTSGDPALLFNERIAYFINCTFILAAGGSAATIYMSDGPVTLIDCAFVFSHIGQGIFFYGTVAMQGGSIAATGTVPTAAFYHEGTGRWRNRGVDLSQLGAGKSLVNVAANLGAADISFEQCRLGAGVALTTGANGGDCRVFLDNSDSADTQSRMQHHGPEGDSYSETTILRVGGATNRTTALSHKMVTSAGRTFHTPLYGPEMLKWNHAVGSSRTISVEVLHDSVTKLQDDEIWLEVEYLGTSGFPKSLFALDRMTDILATPADQDASVVDWVTTGLTNPNKQKLSVAVTPQGVGWIRCRVALAKSSYTVFVDPNPAVS